MPQRKLTRREFLKLAIAAAGAAGLSHFRVLNIGGADVALAQWDECTDTTPDACNPPGNPDTCPEGSVVGGDTCSATDSDFCEPVIFVEPDDCTGDDPDVCDLDDGDSCVIAGPDTCEPGQTPDNCDPFGTSGPADPDFCTPGWGGTPGDPDVCPDPPPGDGDVCYAADSMLYDPDVCDTTPPYTDEDDCQGEGAPDLCTPGIDPDQPNPVVVGSVGAESASSVLPSLGGVAAALGAAALWLRHRLRPEKPEEPETE